MAGTIVNNVVLSDSDFLMRMFYFRAQRY